MNLKALRKNLEIRRNCSVSEDATLDRRHRLENRGEELVKTADKINEGRRSFARARTVSSYPSLHMFISPRLQEFVWASWFAIIQAPPQSSEYERLCQHLER